MQYHGDLEYFSSAGGTVVRFGRYGFTSLAFKSNGNPAISHCRMDREGSGLHGVEYIEFDGIQWEPAVPVPSEWVSGSTSLAIDGHSRPWIGYSKPSSSVNAERCDFKVAHFTGFGWDIWTVGVAGSNGAGESLTLDPIGMDGAVWMAYDGRGTGYLSCYTGSSWQTHQMPFAMNARADMAALAFDPVTGKAVVACRGLDYNLWLAREAGSGWAQERLTDDGSVDVHVSVEFDLSGEHAILEGNRYWTPEPGTIALLALGGLAMLWR